MRLFYKFAQLCRNMCSGIFNRINLNIKISKVILLFSAAIGAGSCALPSEIGADFLEGGSVTISYTDTLSLKVSTVIFDSLATLGNGRLLVGYVEDPQIGKIQSASYFQLKTNAPTEFDDENEYQYQYIALRLEYDDYSYYDTTREVNLKAYEIGEEIELEDDGKLYNNKTFKKKLTNGQAVPMGEVTFVPSPIRFDTLEIPLSDSFGQTIFQLLKDGDKKVTDQTDFLDFFRGIVIETDMAKSSCFLGFKPTSSLRLHYIDNGVPKQNRYLDFPIGSIYYNNIIVNSSQTALKDLNERRYDLPSTKTNNIAYFQNGVGMGVRVEIPHLKSILTYDENLIVSQAVLKIYPLKVSYKNNNCPLPRSFTMYGVDKFNDIFRVFQNSLLLVEDKLLSRDTHYEADITQFVNLQLGTTLKNENALLFSSTSPGTNADRVYVGDDNYSQYRMELRVYYSQVK